MPKSVPAKHAAPAKSAAPVAASFLDDELASAAKTCPSCKTKVKFDTVLCVKCGYNFRERKKVESHVPAAAQLAPGMKCTKCGSQDTRKVNDNELEAYKDRKETAVAIGRPLICNKCGHMFEPPASLGNYFVELCAGNGDLRGRGGGCGRGVFHRLEVSGGRARWTRMGVVTAVA